MYTLQCFVEIGPPVPEKIFEGVLPYLAWRSSWSYDLNYLCTHMLNIEFGFNWPSGFRRQDL